MVEAADSDGDGKVSFEDFYNISAWIRNGLFFFFSRVKIKGKKFPNY
jgi:hypothetical protein